MSYWQEIGSAAAVGAAVGTIAGAMIAWVQLRRVAKAAGNPSILQIYELIDDPEFRNKRREFWQDLHDKDISLLSENEWDTIEMCATKMDTVGTLIKHSLINEAVIFERYAEVIIPLWKEMKPFIIVRRKSKGSFGWGNFELMYERAMKWSEKHRGITMYRRFRSTKR